MSAHKLTTVDHFFNAQKTAKIKKLSAQNAAVERAADPEAAKQNDEDEAERAKLAAAIEKHKRNPLARKRPAKVEAPATASVASQESTVIFEVITPTPEQVKPPELQPNKKLKTTEDTDASPVVVSRTTIDEDGVLPSWAFHSLLHGLNPPVKPSVGSSNSNVAPRARPTPPDIESMRKYNRRPGGEELPPGLFFHATYENSHTIGKILGTLADFAEMYTLLFTDSGMEVLTQDNGRVWTFLMKIPASAFLCYNNLCESSMMFVVMGSKMKRFAAACTPQKTLTFCRRQNGDDNEALDLMLFPLDGKEETGSVQRAQFKQYECEYKRVLPVDCYQYKIIMYSHVLAKQLKHLAAESPDIALELSKTTFKLSAIDQELGGDQSVGFPVKSTLREVLEQPSGESCYIEQIAPLSGAAEKITLAAIPHMRFIAAYLVRMMHFECDAKLVELRIGVRDNPFSAERAKEESPLCVIYDYAVGTPGNFQVKMWLAPEIEMN